MWAPQEWLLVWAGHTQRGEWWCTGIYAVFELAGIPGCGDTHLQSQNLMWRWQVQAERRSKASSHYTVSWGQLGLHETLSEKPETCSTRLKPTEIVSHVSRRRRTAKQRWDTYQSPHVNLWSSRFIFEQPLLCPQKGRVVSSYLALHFCKLFVTMFNARKCESKAKELYECVTGCLKVQILFSQ